jgi:hypothetical protein
MWCSGSYEHICLRGAGRGNENDRTRNYNLPLTVLINSRNIALYSELIIYKCENIINIQYQYYK